MSGGAWDDPAVRKDVRETIAAERGPSGTGHDEVYDCREGDCECDRQGLAPDADCPYDGFPADPPVAVPGPASAPDCVCAEINIRHCPVHGQGEPGPASVSPAEPPEWFKRPSTYRPEFEKHASPEAIQEHIAQARNHAELIQYELGWLEGLYLRRVAERAAGRWP